MKVNWKRVGVDLTVGLLILSAYICRFPGIAGSYHRELGILRSVIYIGLYVVWGFSVYNRIMQAQVRRYMVAIALLMVFWFAARTMKYNFISEIAHPNIFRYLWYLYYLPMLSIPLLTMFVSFSTGKPEDYRLPGWSLLFYIPLALLFLLVITNDFHQLVFTFPDNVPTDSNNGYAFGYVLIVIWMFTCTLITLIRLCRKRRMAGSIRLMLLASTPIAVMIVYLLLYYTRVEWLRSLFADMTAVMCLLYAAALEICIRCGFIQANTHYLELFDASTVGAQITDDSYKVWLSSSAAKPAAEEQLRRTEQGPVLLESGIRLSGAPIRGGHVVWTEDISALLMVLDELRDARENLEDTNGILEEENAVKAREAHIAEQDRLYNMIQRDTARQIRLMDELIRQVEQTGSEADKLWLLRKMLVIGAYLKRRSNLVFLADKASMLEAKELDLTFRESLDNLEMCGVVCGFRSVLREPLLAVHIMSMYDFFEEIVERSLDCLESLTVYAGASGDCLFLTVNTDSAAELSALASDTVTVKRDEDGEQQLTLRLRMGGDSQ